MCSKKIKRRRYSCMHGTRYTAIYMTAFMPSSKLNVINLENAANL